MTTRQEEQARETLRTRIARRAVQDGRISTAVPDLSLFRYSGPNTPRAAMYEPSVCVSVQGSKRVLLGEEAHVYDCRNFLITSVHLPTVVQVLNATPEKPFLGLVLKLDMREISQLMVDSNLPSPRAGKSERGITVGKLTLQLLGAFNRLIDLLDAPQDIAILSPIIRREITYRILVGNQGARLRQVALAGSHGHQVAQAVDWLKESYAEPLRIEDLAARVHMSASAFHHHFRALTAMSPLQFQKWLRLSEARRLMLAEHLNAATAAFRVGYESPSQFSREYRRLFHAPPLRDVQRLRHTARAEAEA